MFLLGHITTTGIANAEGSGKGWRGKHLPQKMSVPNYFLLLEQLHKKILRFNSALFLHVLLAMVLVAVDELHSTVKAFPFFHFLSSTQDITQSGIFNLEMIDACDFSLDIFGRRRKKRSCFSWSISGNIKWIHPLIHLYRSCWRCKAKAHSLFRKVWTARLPLHFCVPVNIHCLLLMYRVNLWWLLDEKKMVMWESSMQTAVLKARVDDVLSLYSSHFVWVLLYAEDQLLALCQCSIDKDGSFTGTCLSSSLVYV